MLKLAISFLTAASLLNAAVKRRAPAAEPEVPPAHTKIIDAGDDLTVLNTHPNHEITIRVPPGETVSDVELGDGNWKPSHFEKTAVDFVSVRCAFPNHDTTMHIIAKAPNQKKPQLYSFALTLNRRLPADVTVLLKHPDIEQQPDPEILKAQEETAQARREANAALESKEKADASLQAMTEHLAKWKREYPSRLTVAYTINGNKKAAKEPWYILGMAGLGDQTFVFHKEDTGDLPMLFVYGSDGNPLQVRGKYDPDTNIYSFNRKLHRGYFTFGPHSRKLPFAELRSK